MAARLRALDVRRSQVICQVSRHARPYAARSPRVASTRASGGGQDASQRPLCSRLENVRSKLSVAVNGAQQFLGIQNPCTAPTTVLSRGPPLPASPNRRGREAETSLRRMEQPSWVESYRLHVGRSGRGDHTKGIAKSGIRGVAAGARTVATHRPKPLSEPVLDPNHPKGTRPLSGFSDGRRSAQGDSRAMGPQWEGPADSSGDSSERTSEQGAPDSGRPSVYFTTNQARCAEIMRFM